MRGLRGRGSRATATTVASNASPIARRVAIRVKVGRVSTPESSSIFQKYPAFLKDKHRIEFLCNGLKPIIDGKIKPDQLQPLLEAEIKTREEGGHGPLTVLSLVGDSLPGIGIIAAVLGIINTMAAIAEGPEAVGEKVAAALTGTFLGILGAYGFINPLTISNITFAFSIRRTAGSG